MGTLHLFGRGGTWGAAVSDEPTLEKGVSGDWVVYLQEMMRDAGFWEGYPDGTFDDDLEQAVEAMQDGLGLSRTGVVDADTWSALEQRAPRSQNGQQTDADFGAASGQDPTSGQDPASSQDPTSGQDSASAGYDADSWNAFLAENGPRWNGDDAAWEQFRAWFAYQADQAGLADPAAGFLAYVDGEQDKIAAFAAYGVTIASPAGAGDGTSTRGLPLGGEMFVA